MILNDARIVFISYAHKDTGSKYPEEIIKAVKIIGINAEIWTDQDPRLIGINWEAEIIKQLGRASAAILLIDWAFLQSSFIKDREIPHLCAKRASNDFLLIPILVETCTYEEVIPWINTWPMEQ